VDFGGGIEDLGTLPGGTYSAAYAVSGDGLVVVGEADDASMVPRAIRWTAATGMQDLGSITVPSNLASARAANGDGSVVVGYAHDSGGLPRAFHWTALGGMQDLGTLGGDRAEALALSADGTVVTGVANNIHGQTRAFRFTSVGGMVDLGSLGGVHSYATAVSADGNVVVGRSANQQRAFRWTAGGGMHEIGMFHQGNDSRAYGTNDDGTIIVGEADGRAFLWELGVFLPIGTRYCSSFSIPNSTGNISRMEAFGSPLVADNVFQLSASGLPLNSFGYFLGSRNQGSVFPVSNSQGYLCLGSSIGRAVGGVVLNSGITGSISVQVNLTAMPQPLGPVAIVGGEVWNFQAWHRDANPTLTSNFTDGLAVYFQ
jgi:probable HAF family extracellular repeat protein